MGRLDGKVAFITGAGRGQGRSHAVRMAEEGANIIAIDICHDIPSNPYPMSSPEDLAETAKLVEATGRGIATAQADVRDRAGLEDALSKGISEFGRLDIVVANAGILPSGETVSSAADFQDAIDVDLVGVMNAVSVSLPVIADGGSIIVTGSTAGMMPNTLRGGSTGGSGYVFAKQILIPYVEQMCLHLASRMIRVNGVHPTNCNTHLIHNKEIYALFRPDLETVTREDFIPASTAFQAMPIPWVEPVDISNLMVFLASDESRYITGQHIRVDAGSLLKFPNGPG